LSKRYHQWHASGKRSVRIRLTRGNAIAGIGGGYVIEVILKRFESPDETRTFSKGKFEIIHFGGMTIGRSEWNFASSSSSGQGTAAAWKRVSCKRFCSAFFAARSGAMLGPAQPWRASIA
jgi:hypothetical protein